MREPRIVPGFPNRGVDWHVERDDRGVPTLVLHEGTYSDGRHLRKEGKTEA